MDKNTKLNNNLANNKIKITTEDINLKNENSSLNSNNNNKFKFGNSILMILTKIEFTMKFYKKDKI